MRVAGGVDGASLGGLRAAVVVVEVVLVVDEALAFGGALGGVAHDHHGGFYTRKHAHAALACGLHACRPQLQIVITGQANERTPA